MIGTARQERLPLLTRRSRARATPMARQGWRAALVVVVVSATAVLGFTSLFTVFAGYDDEGYFLLSIKGYLSGAALYNQTYGTFGPFYWEAMAGIFKALGLQVTNDAGRMITLVFWLLTAGLLGVAVARLSRCFLLGVLVDVLVFGILNKAPGEPASPGHLLMLLLAGLVAATTLVTGRHMRLAFALIGFLTAALVLSKINLGAFAVAALLFAIVLASPGLRARWFPVAVVVTYFVLLPLVLMSSFLFLNGYMTFWIHLTIGLSALTFVILMSNPGREPGPGARRWLPWLLLGGAVVTVVAFAVAFLGGTSFSALMHGTVIDAYSQRAVNPTAPFFPHNVLLYDAVGLALAAAVGLRAFPSSRGWLLAGAIARTAAGVAILVSAFLDAQGIDVAGIPVALAWVAAVPTRLEPATPAGRFVRFFIPALALAEVLHGFPVAGSQVIWSSVLLVVLGAICIGDGLAEAGALPLGLGTPAARLALAGGIGLAVWAALVAIVYPMNYSLPLYRHEPRLDAAGAKWLHIYPPQSAELESVVATLKDHCLTFVTLPGLSSFYLMTGMQPPTWEAMSVWPFRWDASFQRKILDQVRNVPGLCAVSDQNAENLWADGRAIRDYPLHHFITHAFHPIATIGEYVVMARNRTAVR